MRKAIRVAVLVLLSYLVQASLLSSFKLNGVMVDLMTITVYTIGYAYGVYAGITAGTAVSMIVEVTSGDPAGLSVVYVAIGFLGYWLVRQMRMFQRAGSRTLEQNIKRVAPMVFLALIVIAKESVYLAYFYLTGMDIALGHVLKVLLAGVVTGIAGIVLLPLMFRILRRGPEDTFIGKWKARRKEKGKGKPVGYDKGGKRRPKTPAHKKKKKGAQGAKESLLSLINPVIDELNTPPEEAEEIEETYGDDDGLSMEDMLGMPHKEETEPVRRELTEDELSIFKRPTPKQAEDDKDYGDDGGYLDYDGYDDDEPPEGGSDT